MMLRHFRRNEDGKWEEVVPALETYEREIRREAEDGARAATVLLLVVRFLVVIGAVAVLVGIWFLFNGRAYGDTKLYRTPLCQCVWGCPGANCGTNYIGNGDFCWGYFDQATNILVSTNAGFCISPVPTNAVFSRAWHCGDRWPGNKGQRTGDVYLAGCRLSCCPAGQYSVVTYDISVSDNNYPANPVGPTVLRVVGSLSGSMAPEGFEGTAGCGGTFTCAHQIKQWNHESNSFVVVTYSTWVCPDGRTRSWIRGQSSWGDLLTEITADGQTVSSNNVNPVIPSIQCLTTITDFRITCSPTSWVYHVEDITP